MKMKLYSLRDSKVASYMNVMQSPNDQVMIRSLTHALSNRDSEMFLNASDLDLYCLGELDTNTGLIIPEVTFVVNLGGLVNVG